MIECYNLPSCIPVCGLFRPLVDNRIQDGVEVANIVLQEQKGNLETGMLGITYSVWIAVSELATKPRIVDHIEINGQLFKFQDVALKNQSAVIYPFYQCSLKTTKLN